MLQISELQSIEPVLNERIRAGRWKLKDTPRLRLKTTRALAKAEAGDHVLMYVLKLGKLAGRGLPARVRNFLTRDETRNDFVFRGRSEKAMQDSTPHKVAGIDPGSYSKDNPPKLSVEAREHAARIRARADARLAAGGFDIEAIHGEKIIRMRRKSNVVVRGKRQPSIRTK